MFALEYHETTKHHFHRFAQSAGYLDWATQPDPFRRFTGAPLTELSHEAVLPDVPYETLYDGLSPAVPLTWASIGDLLRCSMGLSAWKQYQTSRWALRVNPSSGNLHPTEAYVVWQGRVHHYAPRDHIVEERCRIRPASQTESNAADEASCLLIGLTSILWREAWKYGERAFRYCQHDVGHAIAAIRLAASRLGWRLRPIDCADADIAALLGLDRDDDFRDVEREMPEYLAVVTAETAAEVDLHSLVARAREGTWSGRANRLSPRWQEWPLVEKVARATGYSGPVSRAVPTANPVDFSVQRNLETASSSVAARAIVLQRRSAVAFDGKSSLPFDVFASMLNRLCPDSCPWDAIDWPPQVHLAIFVHRVEGLAPGLYAFLRDASAVGAWRSAMRPDFLWEVVPGLGTRGSGLGSLADTQQPNLFLLLPMDLKWPAMRVSCDQDIAGDGFFSLGMIARFEPALRERGEWFYRRLFWECGVIGQVLYLEAEAAGARATGIGCFFDDPVHEMLGLTGRDWQSLYHFSMGVPVDDTRLTTEKGYGWE